MDFVNTVAIMGTASCLNRPAAVCKLHSEISVETLGLVFIRLPNQISRHILAKQSTCSWPLCDNKHLAFFTHMQNPRKEMISNPWNSLPIHSLPLSGLYELCPCTLLGDVVTCYMYTYCNNFCIITNN